MQLNLERTLTLNTNYTKPKIFIVIGAGGTGGYFIPNLARQVSLENKLRRVQGLLSHEIVIADFDLVEPHNLNRQNFIEKDLGRNKAAVLAERYGMAFGIEIKYLDSYITESKQLVDMAKKYLSINNCIPVFVDCVDNNATRVLIHEAINQLSDVDRYYLSSGNEQYNGQVVCGFKLSKWTPKEYYEDRFFETPMVTEMFPEILEGGDKLPTEMSCDEAAVSHPQNIMTNIFAANHLFNFANMILTANVAKRDNPGLKYFAVTFDTQTGVQRTFPNKKSVIGEFIDVE